MVKNEKENAREEKKLLKQRRQGLRREEWAWKEKKWLEKRRMGFEREEMARNEMIRPEIN